MRFTNLDGFTTGRKTVAVPGTAEQLSSTSTKLPPGVTLLIKAMSSNTGTIHLGNSLANADSVTSTVSFRLAQNQSLSLDSVQNLNQIWLDATVAAEGVEFVFEGQAT